MWKFYAAILLLTLLSSTTDVYSKKGGSVGSSSSRSGGGILSKIKNTFTNRGHQSTGLRKPASMPRPAPNFPSSNRGGTSWKAPAVGVGAGVLGGYGAHKWARNAGHSRYSGLSPNKKAALSGTLGALAGGYVGYKVGKAVGRYNTFYGGRNYWYGSRYYSPTGGRKTCIFEIDSSSPNWNVMYDDNTAVREVIFECMPHEQCCELSCCRAPTTYVRSSSHRGWHWWHTLLLLFVLGIILAVCVFGGTKAMESRRENSAPIAMATYDEDESRKPFNQPDQYSNYPPSYPAAYPTQPTVYPSCPPSYPAAYPQQPPAYTTVH